MHTAEYLHCLFPTEYLYRIFYAKYLRTNTYTMNISIEYLCRIFLANTYAQRVMI